MLAEEGWTDIGNDTEATRVNPDQHTCHANAEVKKSRVDFISVNEILAPAIKSFEVINEGKFPTHRPIRIRVATAQLKTVTNSMRRPTNFATMFQEKVEKDTKAKQETMDAEARATTEDAKKTTRTKLGRSTLTSSTH